MKYNKFVWLTLIQLTCLKESCLSNSTQTVPPQRNESTITTIVITSPPLLNSSAVTVGANEKTHLDLLEIFHGGTNVTRNGTTNHPIVTLVTESITETNVNNTTTDDISTLLSWNDTIKTNYTLTSEAIASEEKVSFRLESAGAIAAGVFLVSAVVGYFSCVGYRRFMQKKYGNSQILAGEDVYDTSDLRYFEI